MTWTAFSDTTSPGWGDPSGRTDEGWRRLSVVTDMAGVDFQLKIDNQYPWKVWDHDPLTIIDAAQGDP